MKFFILFLHSLEEKFHAKDHEMEMFQERTKSTAPDKLSSGTVTKAINQVNSSIYMKALRKTQHLNDKKRQDYEIRNVIPITKHKFHY
ncbi:hypothetical protein ACSLWF_07435 [Salmonella enterica]|uniref:hypothetical protein n=1 Tax=Salmonella enterica TaxID=28901 RepID=UPI003EDBD961